MSDGNKKKVTIKDIAEACGVSTATVSYVVNGREDQRISPETWKRVMHEVHLMGYESSAVAKALATGNNNAVGLYAPRLRASPARAYENLCFISQLTEALEARRYQLRFVGDACRHTTINTLDAIVTLDVDGAAFRQIGFNCFYPLICVDGIVDDPRLFYQVNSDYERAAGRARELGGRAAAVFEPFAEPRLNERIGACFDAAFCVAPGGEGLREFAAAQPGGTVFVAVGALLAERLRCLTAAPVLSMCPDGDLEADTARKAETVAGLLMDTIRGEPPEKHDIVI